MKKIDRKLREKNVEKWIKIDLNYENIKINKQTQFYYSFSFRNGGHSMPAF